MEYIYFMQDDIRDAVKIGVSATPHIRRAHLSTASASDIKLLGCIEGGRTREKLLHDRFSAKRLNGEWFKVDDDLLAAISQILGEESVEAPHAKKQSEDPYVAVTADAIERMATIMVERGQTKFDAYNNVAERCGLSKGNVENFLRRRRVNISVQEYSAVQAALRLLVDEEIARLRALFTWIKSSSRAKPSFDVEHILSELSRIEALTKETVE